MAEILRDSERLVCIGQTALRGPDGRPYKAVPMYIKVDAGAAGDDGLSDGERALHADIGGILAGKIKAYLDGGGIHGGGLVEVRG